jgi:hypothetical protein
MLRITGTVSLLVLIAACAGDPCSRAICGCWKKHTFREVILVTDHASQPVSGMTLFCETTQRPFGITNASGTARVRVSGRTSPGCGVAADCEATSLRTSTGEVIATVNMTVLLRRERVAAGEYGIQAIREEN